MGVAGKTFAIIAADTRMSDGYSIRTRNKSKCSELTSHCVLASSGMQADVQALQKVLNARTTWVEYQHRKEMPLESVSQLLSNTLYGKRFFPYYAFNVLGGVNEKGEGFVFGYDAVGNFEAVKWTANGSGQQLMMPLLDNQVGKHSQLKPGPDMTAEQMIALIKEAFTCAGERDIYTGDQVEIHLITKEGIKKEIFSLKDD